MNSFAISMLFFTVISVFSIIGLSKATQTQPPLQTAYITSYVHQIEGMKIRLLALKHSKEHMADGDANLAIQAVKKAAGKGLSIQDVGNHFVDKNGQMQAAFYDFNYEINRFRDFLAQQMPMKAVQGDTLIIFTIGHGFPSGGLHNMGQRKEVLQAIGEAAEKNNQRVLWWQLSCYALASLPAINTLPPKQQELVSIMSSSTAQETSAAYIQGKIMEKVFMALAEKNKSIDPNGDGKITATELKGFLDSAERGKGKLLYAKTPEYVIFGPSDLTSLANKIPIIDRNEQQREYPKDYIPSPGGS